MSWINSNNLKFTLNVGGPVITLRKLQKLFLRDFAAISARLLLFVNTSEVTFGEMPFDDLTFGEVLGKPIFSPYALG